MTLEDIEAMRKKRIAQLRVRAENNTRGGVVISGMLLVLAAILFIKYV